MPTWSAEPSGASTGVSLRQAHGDTIVYRIYFREGDKRVDPLQGVTYSFVAKQQGDYDGEVIISLNTDGQLLRKTDTSGDEYLELKLAPTAPLIDLFSTYSHCNSAIREHLTLDAELSWNNGGEIRRTRMMRLTYTHGVIAADEVFQELDPPTTGLSSVTLYPGNLLGSGAGTVTDPLVLYWDSEEIELDVAQGNEIWDLSTFDYSSLGYTPTRFQAVGFVPPGALSSEFNIWPTLVKGTSVKSSAKIPAAGWKIRVLAFRPAPHP